MPTNPEISISNDDLEIKIFEPEDFVVVEINDLLDLSILGSKDYSWMESEVIRLTNIERAKYKLPPLARNEALCRSALLHTLDMAENHFISHTGSDGSDLKVRINRTGYKYYMLVGENLAMGSLLPETVTQGWMNSPGHRANMLHPGFTEIGVSYIEGDVPTGDGQGYFRGSYWTQHFGARFMR